jgi:hypothetical protein
MNDAARPPLEPTPEEEFRRILDERPEPTPEVSDALEGVEAARQGLEEALDQLTRSSRSALDIPAKIRRNPVKTAALVGGAGFLLAGGPRRAVRFATRGRRARPSRHAGLLPPEIEKVLKDAGLASDTEVRRALDDDFAEYLRRKGKAGPEPSAATTFWRTFDRVAGPLGTAGARILVQRLMEADRSRGVGRGGAGTGGGGSRSSSSPGGGSGGSGQRGTDRP